MYEKVERPAQHNGGRGFEHEVKVRLNRNSTDRHRLDLLLKEIGEKHKAWRLRTQYKYDKDPKAGIVLSGSTGYTEAVVRFNNANDAMRFRLSWQNEI